MMNKRVLIACEFSGIVREAFNAYSGIHAISCDLLPPEDGRVDYHHQGDVRDLLKPNLWDMMIAFPSCTYLCGSGLHWNKRRPERKKLTEDAIEFAALLWNASIPLIVMENPIGILSTRLTRPSQYIQPYDFGHSASKKTCLWIKGLPPLTVTNHINGRIVEWPKGSGKFVERWDNQTDSGQNRLPPSEHRWMDRSRTYPGIAQAMATQWIPYLLGIKAIPANSQDILRVN